MKAVLGLLAALGFLATGAALPAQEKTPPGFFGLDKLWSFHLDIDAKDFTLLPPKKGGMPGPKKDPDNKPAVGAGGFGYDYTYVPATFTADGTVVEKVGVRYKGNGSYMMSTNLLKRPFKIDFDRYVDGQRFQGQAMLALNNSVVDPTRMREALSYALYRAAGVPAPRTAFAEVTLSVPGKHSKELLGLYVVIESIDKRFLQDRFQTGKGMVLRPERMRGVDYLGEKWEAYADRYLPKKEPTDAEKRRLIEFTKLINVDDDDRFRKMIGDYLDLDNFTRFLAATTLLATMDSFLMLGHNYQLYLHPKTNRFLFMPWDLDHSFGGFMLTGSASQLMDLSIDHPHVGKNALIDRVLAIDRVKQMYRERLRELTRTHFTEENVKKQVAAAEAAIKPAVSREKKAAAARGEGSGLGGFVAGIFVPQPPGLANFVARRVESVNEQLDGKRKGVVPSSFLFAGRDAVPAKKPGAALLRPVLDAADTDKDGKLSRDEWTAAAKRLFESFDSDRTKTIDVEILTARLVKLAAAPKGAVAVTAGTIKSTLAKRLGAKSGATLTQASFEQAAAKAFDEFDRDRNATLDEREITAALDALLTAAGVTAEKK